MLNLITYTVCGIFYLSICNLVYSDLIMMETSVYNSKVNNIEITGSYENVTSCNLTIDILIQFVNSKHNSQLQKNFFNFVLSLLSRTTCKINLYITCDADGKKLSGKIFESLEQEFDWLILPKIIYLDVHDLSKNLTYVINPMQELFSSNVNSYYQLSLFFIPVALHRVLPHNLSKLIMFDIDLQLGSDVKDLFVQFESMSGPQIMGLAREQQPVYFHVTWEYREKNKHTKVGAPPPDGLTGFNSGTKIMNLDAMRQSVLYNSYLDKPDKLVQLANKYNFRGHLGDQDFFSLLSFEHMELFHILPCQWNRQLCEWWRESYKDVFDSYFHCDPPYFVLHGNCGTPIPS